MQQIRDTGAKSGIALNPATPIVNLDYILDDIDMITIMTVNPGFGGQEFIPGTLQKIRQVRDSLTERGLDCEVEVDGGINEQTARRVVEAGADVLVAGSSVYGAADGVGAAIPRLIAHATGKSPH